MELPSLPDMSVLDPEGVEKLATFVREYLSKYDLDVSFKLKPKRACPKKSSIEGPGLEDGEVDIPSSFAIKARDNNGNPLTHGDVPFEVKVSDPEGKEVPASVTDNGDGTYKVEFTPAVPGPHDVRVALDGEDLQGSPARPDVAPPTPDPAFCTASGPGLEHAVVGERAPFTIYARNKANMPLKAGGHKFDVVLHGPHGDVLGSVADNGDGTYAAEYVPLCEGADCKVDVTTAGSHISQSPFHVPVDKAAGKADAASSYAFGPGVDGGCDTWHPATFTVQAVDPTGAKLTHGGDLFEATVTDAKGEELPVTLADNGDGTYSGSYHAARPERHVVEVVLRRPLEPLFYEHVQRSPFAVDVLPGLDPSKCLCSGPGLESGHVEDTKPTHFTVQARDILGNDVRVGGAPFAAKVTDPSGEDVPASVTDNGDGTYRVDYAPQCDGVHEVRVTLEEAPVAASPYAVEVVHGADASSSGIKEYGFVVASRGKDGQLLPYGGEKVEVKVRRAGDEEAEVCEARVEDRKDGSYSVSYELPPGSGEFLLHVYINGKELKCSPLKQVIP